MAGNRRLDVVVVGVGGQGLITLSTVIAKAALRRGYNAIVAETHGLSQRGGTVIVHLRLGSVEAPLIPYGRANLMLSMELIEAARYLNYLEKSSMIVANNYIAPPPLPKVAIPPRERLVDALKQAASRLLLVDATATALKLGDPRTANMVLLGAALEAGALQPFIDREAVEQVVREQWPRAAEQNLEALRAGIEAARARLESV